MTSPQRHGDHRENLECIARDRSPGALRPVCLGGRDSCETKPREGGSQWPVVQKSQFGSPTGIRGVDYAKQTQFSPDVRKWARASSVTTEPGGAEDAKQTQSPSGTPVFHCSIIPAVRFDANGTKQSQSEEESQGSSFKFEAEEPCAWWSGTSNFTLQTSHCRPALVRKKPNWPRGRVSAVRDQQAFWEKVMMYRVLIRISAKQRRCPGGR